jgi:long-chain acyl-CoA synthetase
MTHSILLDKIASNASKEAIIWKDRVYSFKWLLDRAAFWDIELKKKYHLTPGMVVQLEGDFSPETCALLISLINNKNIIVPLRHINEETLKEYQSIARIRRVFRIDDDDAVTYEELCNDGEHELFDLLRQGNEAGLVLFSSGTTGKPKAIVHSADKLLQSTKYFNVNLPSVRTVSFFLFDHISGVDCLFYSFLTGSTLIFPTERTPAYICGLIEKYRAELLPASPTFLYLLLMSEEYQNYDLSSLKFILYGSEIMPPVILDRINQLLPNCTISQAYGLSELGCPQTKSRGTNSLWLKINSDDFQTKVKDGTLWIKAGSAMLGYLNAPSFFDEEGWFNTGDKVEVDDREYIKILGRDSDIITVGGQKVYPAEIENVLLQMSNITDVAVFGEPNPILGQIVKARVNLAEEESITELRKRIKEFCRGKLEQYKIPVKVEIASTPLFNANYKRVRR